MWGKHDFDFVGKGFVKNVGWLTCWTSSWSSSASPWHMATAATARTQKATKICKNEQIVLIGILEKELILLFWSAWCECSANQQEAPFILALDTFPAVRYGDSSRLTFRINALLAHFLCVKLSSKPGKLSARVNSEQSSANDPLWSFCGRARTLQIKKLTRYQKIMWRVKIALATGIT